MYSNVEIISKFSVNHNKSQKLYFKPQLFTQQKNMSYKETFDKILFQNRFYTQTLVKWSWHSNVSHTES